MSNQKLSNAVLSDMSAEDLLMLGEDSLNLIADIPTLPDGFYHFVLKNQEIGEVGNEKDKAIVCEIVITGVNQLVNEADQQHVDALDLATNPITIRSNYSLASKDGYGVRDYMTFTSAIAAKVCGANSSASVRIEKLNGCQGILHLTVNTYLPKGKPDSPENYRQSNRVKSTDTLWD
jgi:hypothetical protein